MFVAVDGLIVWRVVAAGACTVQSDGRRVLSWLTLTAAVQDKAVTTIDGLAHGEVPHPMRPFMSAHVPRE